MTEKEILESLIKVQKVDDEIQAIKKQKDELLGRAKEYGDRIAANAAEFNMKKMKLDEQRKKRALIDVEIKAKQGEIKAKEEHGREIKTNDAFRALENEIESLRQAIRKHEDDILVIMEEEETVAAWVKAQEKAMKEEDAQLTAEMKALEAQAAEKDAQAAGIKTRRDEACAGVEKIWLERYERVRKNKGRALAKVIEGTNGDGKCGGCNFNIRPQTIIEMKKGNAGIKMCENCARIWYIE
ncbi:MAG: hypothetical protein LLG37_05795 [Spirochaetia bacterium]|nr:hypothetical protein [Spirochaetia bacterium]